MTNTRPLNLTLGARGGLIRVPTVGVLVAAAPGLVVTPWYADGRPVPSRFSLVHADSGMMIVKVSLCAHDARRWAVAAGWIGVDWRAPAFTVTASGPAETFAWRMCDEWRAHCDACPPVPVVDDHSSRLLKP